MSPIDHINQQAVATYVREAVWPRNKSLQRVGVTQRPKRRNFECNSYKMALKIAPAKKFLLNVQPESRQAIGDKSCTSSTICTQSIYRTKERFFSIREIETFSL
jgi:hypothetical protein